MLLARFSGEWNLAQSRAATNSRSAVIASPSDMGDIMHDSPPSEHGCTGAVIACAGQVAAIRAGGEGAPAVRFAHIPSVLVSTMLRCRNGYWPRVRTRRCLTV